MSKRETFDEEERDYRVLAVHYMFSWHNIKAVSIEAAIDVVDLPGSLCHQCSDDYEYDAVADLRVLDPESQEQLYSCGFITDEKKELETLETAAKNLFAQMDFCLGSQWRDDTLVITDKSDAVNYAWVQLAKLLNEPVTADKLRSTGRQGLRDKILNRDR